MKQIHCHKHETMYDACRREGYDVQTPFNFAHPYMIDLFGVNDPSEDNPVAYVTRHQRMNVAVYYIYETGIKFKIPEDRLESVQWIAENLRPEYVFDMSTLSEWAKTHGFYKKEKPLKDSIGKDAIGTRV